MRLLLIQAWMSAGTEGVFLSYIVGLVYCIKTDLYFLDILILAALALQDPGTCLP